MPVANGVRCPTCGSECELPPRFAGLQLSLFDDLRRAGSFLSAAVATPVPDAPPATLPPSIAGEQAPRGRPSSGRKPKTAKTSPDALSPRDRLALRLEVAVWFVGVTLAVGGALLATRLFWDQLPELFRPGIIGLGLSSIGGAFIAGGGVLAKRYPRAHAGDVLSMVGRLFAFAAALPVAPLFNGHVLIAAGSLGLLSGVVGLGHLLAVRFGNATRSSTAMTLGGMALAAAGPLGGWSTALVTAAGATLARVGLAASHRRALRGERVVVNDLGSLAAGAFAIGSAWVTTQLETVSAVALLLVGAAALVDAGTRALEARPLADDVRLVLRRTGAGLVIALGGGALLITAGEQAWWLPASAAALLMAAQLRTPTRLGLPAALRAACWGLVALAGAWAASGEMAGVGFGFLVIEPSLIFVLVLTSGFAALAWRAVRDGRALADVALVIGVTAGAIAAALTWMQPGAALALLPVAALLQWHRSVEERPAQALLAMALAAAAGGLALGSLVGAAPDAMALNLMLALLVPAAALGVGLARKRGPTRLGAALLLVAAIGGGLAALVPTSPAAALSLVVVACLLIIAGERTRLVWPILLGAAGALVAAHAAIGFDAIVAGAPWLGGLALLPRGRGRALPTPAWLRLGGRSSAARGQGFTAAAAIAASVLAWRLVADAWSATSFELSWAALALLTTAALVVARTRSSLAVSGTIAAVGVVGWWTGGLGVGLGAAAGSGVLAMVAATMALIVTIVLRTLGWSPRVARRGRHHPSRRTDLELPVVAALLVGLLALGTSAGALVWRLSWPPEAMFKLAVLVGAAAGLAFAAWVARGFSAVFVAGQVLLSAALLLALGASIDRQLMALVWVLALVTQAGLWAFVARGCYRGGGLAQAGAVVERLPSPTLVRAWPYAAGLLLTLGVTTTMASLRVFGGGTMLIAYIEDGFLVVGGAALLTALVVARLHRGVGVWCVVGVAAGGWIFAMRSFARVADWVPSSGGVGTAAWSLALIVAAMTMNSAAPRRAMVRLGASLPRRSRHQLTHVAVLGALCIAVVATLRSVSLDVPHLAAPALAITCMVLAAWAYARRGVVHLSTFLATAGVLLVSGEVSMTSLGLVAAGTLALLVVLDAAVAPVAASKLLSAWRVHSWLSVDRHAARLRSALRWAALLPAALCLLGAADASLEMQVAPSTLLVVVLLSAWLGLRSWRGTWRAREVLFAGACFVIAAAAGALTTEDVAGSAFGAAAAWSVVGLLAVAVLPASRSALARYRIHLPLAARQTGATWGLVVATVIAGASAVSSFPPSSLGAAALLAPLAIFALAPRRSTAIAGGSAALGALVVGAASTAPSAASLLRLASEPMAAIAVSLALGGLVGQAAAKPFTTQLDEFRGGEAASQWASTLRRVAELGVVLGLLVALWGITASRSPTAFSLACTWVTFAAAAIALTRVAARREEALWAALAQGAALAIYVDLRARTGLLDAVEGVDAMVAMAAAGAASALRVLRRPPAKMSAFIRASDLYASTLPVVAAFAGPSDGARALILVCAGALWGAIARARRSMRYELLAGAGLVVATWFALSATGASAVALYALPVACVGTWLGNRHRRQLGVVGRWLSVTSQVPTYVTAAFAALSAGTFGAFALALVLGLAGAGWAYRMRDRRSLYAAGAQIAVLVIGRLTVAGMDNAVLGTLLLIGAGFGVLGVMTALSVARERASAAFGRVRAELSGWDRGLGV